MNRWPRARPILYLVTDRSRLSVPTIPGLLDRIRIAAGAGIHAIQIRERDVSDRILVDLVREAVALTRASGVPVLVNDRLDVALAAGADGVHLRGDSAAPALVRADAPAGFLIGRSVHSTEEAIAVADAGGCDYLLFGTVYSSPGKSPDHPIAGEAALADVCHAVEVPVLAIGGIDAVRAAPVAAAGAAGIAAIGAFANGDAAELTSRVRAMHDAFDRGSSLV